MRIFQKVLPVLIMITAPLLAANGQPSDSLPVYESPDSIIVIGNRFSTSLKNLAYSYQTISGKEVERLSSHSALELVDINFPSAFVLENKVLGYGVGTVGAGMVSLRGMGGKPNTGVLVLLNGHPDFMGIFGHPLPDVYGMDDIQRVEILAGPASTVFGDHALGGVINLVTRPNYNQFIKINTEGGSYGTYSYGLTLTKKIQDNGLFFTVRRQKTDGHVKQSGFESLHLQGGWQYRINSVWDLMIQGRYVPFKFDDPSRGDLDRLNIGAYADIRRGMAEISLHNQSKLLRGSFQLYTNLGRHKFYDGFKSNDFSYGFSAYQFWQFKPTISLAGGLDALYYGGKAKNDFARLPNGKPVVNPDAHQLTSMGMYGMVFYAPLPQINLKAGVRYQYNSLPSSQISPFAGISYTAANHFQFYANYQTGFRTPTLMELYLFPSANKNLKEETVQSFETGVTYNPAPGKSFRITVFKNKARDLIQAIPSKTPPPPVVFQNGPKSDQWGVEGSLLYRLSPFLSARLAYGYLDPDILTAYNPKHQFKYALYLEKRHYYLTIYGKYVQELFAGNNQQMALPDYHVLNAQIGLRAKSLEVYLRFLNVLDRLYYSRPGYRTPGRQARIGLNLRIR